MLEFQLFRIKVYPEVQGQLFERERSRSDILRETLNSLPTAQFRPGLIWHIGNVTELDTAGIYFRLGRTSASTIEIFDPKTSAFVDQEFEAAPYTHVILDFDVEICAIAKKPRLSPTTMGIARQFARLLASSEKASELGADFEIDDIKDPADFISHLKEAYTISKFWVQFSRPNAFDADEDFAKPFQRMLEEANGEKGKTEIKGQHLNAETLEAVTRSAAATGDDAAAWIQQTERARRIKKQLRGNVVNLSQDDVADQQQRKRLLDRVRDLYRKVRGLADR